MKRLLQVAILAAVLGGVLVVPAASARSGARVRLSVLPLPASSLGPAARSLPLQADSGVIDNTDAVMSPLYPNHQQIHVNALYPAKLGRVKGYALDYGLGASGGAGVTEVWTSVDAYRTSADARKGLAAWSHADKQFTEYVGPGWLSVDVFRVKAARVGSARSAFAVVYGGKNISQLFAFDEQFTVGRYLADVTVWAGNSAKAKNLEPTLARKLETRINQALAGGLHANPVKLPPKPPSPGGPDLAPLGLQPTDLSGQATDQSDGSCPARGYCLDWFPCSVFPCSAYTVRMVPAGQFDSIRQFIYWYPTANEASFDDDYESDLFRSPGVIDLSSVGDGAWGVIFRYSGFSILGFSSGQIREVVYAGSSDRVQVTSLAQIVANRINAAGYGS